MQSEHEKLVFFDLETGGLDPRRHPITEIAAIAVELPSYRELETVHFRVQFDPRDADPEALGINKYDPEKWLLAALPPQQVAKKFAAFLRRHATCDRYSAKNGKRYQVAELVAHNGEAFDGPFIQEWFRCQKTYLPASRQVLCTKQRAMWLFREDPSLTPPDNYKLATLCQYFGVANPDHTALRDIQATVQLYRAMTEHSMRITTDQREYLVALSEMDNLSPRQLLNRAINRLASERMRDPKNVAA